MNRKLLILTLNLSLCQKVNTTKYNNEYTNCLEHLLREEHTLNTLH